jgi:hypothetical protein
MVSTHHPVHGRRGLPRHHPRHPEKKGVDDKPEPKLIPLTVNEIRRLFNRVAAPIQHTIAHTLHWSHWRRTSQARARTSHYHRRGHELSLQY